MPISPQNESDRLAALADLQVLDTAPEPAFNGLVEAAAAVCGVPISLISLIDTDRQWFKANVGLSGVTETPREVAFCAHAIQDDGIFEISDTESDPRFSDNPLVTGSPDIRFYAGATLRLSNGARVGTLCVIDQKPRQLTQIQREILQHLSAAAVQALESRRTTAKLMASEARFRALSEAAPLGIFSTDSEGACTFTNARWQAIFGLTQVEALGPGWNRTLHPEDQAKVFAKWQRSAELERDFDMEFRIQHDDGTIVYVRTLSRPVFSEDGEVSGHVGSVEDVSERLQTERTLRDERRRFEAIIEATGAGTWEWNVQTGETRFNNRWANIVGMTKEELGPTTIGTWTNLVHPEDSARSVTLLNQHFDGQSASYDCEARMRHRDGHWVWVLDRGRLLTRTADGKPEWMFGTHLDITERKEQEKALRKSERLLMETGALADIGGWELEIATNTLTWSDQTCRIHGLPPGYKPQLDEAINYYAPEARPVIQAAVGRGLKEGRGWDIELPLVQAGGQHIWVRTVGHVERVDNQPTRLLGAFQNITQSVQQRQALESANERITIATESGNIGVWDWDLTSGKLNWTPQMFALFGLSVTPERIDPKLWANFLHPDDRESTLQVVNDAIAGSGNLDTEFRIVWADGSVHYIRAAAQITRDVDGTALQMLGVNWDVTPLRQLSSELAEQHELLQVTLQSIGDAVITTNADGNVTWLNPAAEQITGWLSAEAQGKPLTDVYNIIDEELAQPAVSPVHTCLTDGKVVGLSKHIMLVSRDGSKIGIEDSAAPIRNKDGDLLGVVLVFHDVTEQRRLSGEMSYRATHDSLTGLINRSEFETRLQQSLNNAHSEQNEHTLMFIDLDQFKLVNDACGHSMGDQLLLQVTKILKNTVRASDTLARLGGDEFGMILENCTNLQAERIAQKICDCMEEYRFVHEERRFRIGTSIGLVPLDDRWTSIEAAMQAADTCCYAAKDAGRNRVHLWFDSDQATHSRHDDTQWAARLEQALDENQFVLHAQRIQSLPAECTGLHAEVLIRMRDTNGNLIPPNAFLPAAERFNLASRIDRWVLQNAINALANLPDISTVETLCINLSERSIGDQDFHHDAVNMLISAGSEICKRICLEVSETAVITEIADSTILINQMRALGVRIAVEDFGAGASSFGYLKTLTVDILKINGQLIEGIVDDPLDVAAVRYFVEVAHAKGLKTIAEFVSNKDIFKRISGIGIDYAQGFFLHLPEPIEHVLLNTNHPKVMKASS